MKIKRRKKSLTKDKKLSQVESLAIKTIECGVTVFKNSIVHGDEEQATIFGLFHLSLAILSVKLMREDESQFDQFADNKLFRFFEWTMKLVAEQLWSMNRVVLSVDQIMLEELCNMKMTEIPPGLGKLPTWCPLVILPDSHWITINTAHQGSIESFTVCGFLAFVDSVPISMLVSREDFSQSAYDCVIALENGAKGRSVDDAVMLDLTPVLRISFIAMKEGSSSDNDMGRFSILPGFILPTSGDVASAKKLAESTSGADCSPAIDLVLPILSYLTAENVDIRSSLDEPVSFMRKKKDIKDSLVSKGIQKWNVGYRIGAKLKKAKEAYKRREDEQEETGVKRRPHVRVAHFHAYWTGPRSGERKQIVRWLSPILVNCESEDDLVITIRDVDFDEQEKSNDRQAQNTSQNLH